MNSNIWTFLSLLVTSLTTIGIALINAKKQSTQSTRIETKLDQNTATTDTVHTIVNSRYDSLVAELAAKQAEIDRLKAVAAPAAP